jgi:hypothetical protein
MRWSASETKGFGGRQEKMPKGIRAIVKALKDIGCHDVSYRDGKHYVLWFSFEGKMADPVTISKTPSDRNAVAAIAADIVRSLKRLGAEPTILKNAKAALSGVALAVGGMGWMPARLYKALTDNQKRKAWDFFIETSARCDQKIEDLEFD